MAAAPWIAVKSDTFSSRERRLKKVALLGAEASADVESLTTLSKSAPASAPNATPSETGFHREARHGTPPAACAARLHVARPVRGCKRPALRGEPVSVVPRSRRSDARSADATLDCFDLNPEAASISTIQVKTKKGLITFYDDGFGNRRRGPTANDDARCTPTFALRRRCGDRGVRARRLFHHAAFPAAGGLGNAAARRGGHAPRGCAPWAREPGIEGQDPTRRHHHPGKPQLR
jgi:hypothetical protein